MQGLVSQRLNEFITGPTFYPTGEITGALNEAYRFFVLLTLGLEKTTAWNVQAATTYFHMLQLSQSGNPLFPDWICPLRLTTSTGAKVRPARLEDLNCLDSQWPSSPGAPVRYCHSGADFLALYQQPALTGTTLQVTYCRGPVILVNAGDTPEIPAEYHPRLVDYGIYRCRQVEGAQQFEKALAYLKDFFEGAKHYAAYVRSRNLGSRYDKVPFEIETYDMSKLLKLRRDLVPSRSTAPQG